MVVFVGALISATPLLWPLTTDQYDPHYGKLPLWILANCGVIALSAAYCVLITLIFCKWRWLWIPFLGFLTVPVAMFAGFAFWALGLLLIPVGPVLLLLAGLIAIQSKKSEQGVDPNRSQPPTQNSTSSIRGSED
jgi:hypothetical protein